MTPLNWAGLEIAFNNVKNHAMAGRPRMAEKELLMLLDGLHQVYSQIKRSVEVEDERKEPRV